MRVFASDMVKKVMARSASRGRADPQFMITKSLERAQTRIEELNFDARKHVLSYDDVMNIQRKSVYSRRRSLLIGGKEAVDAELARLFEITRVCRNWLRRKRRKRGRGILQLRARA